ncbi:MAG: hypothetical protein ACYC6G_15255 [Desulfobaccales bacterium]
MAGLIEKVKGGYKVDGMDLLAANCGCGGLSGPGGSGIGDCCMTFSRVKHDGNTVMYIGKKTTPNTANNFEWGYKVKKDGTQVEVKMLDTRGAAFKFGGVEPPPLSAWQKKGWTVVDQFERPLSGTGEPLPAWCDSAESACERPEVELESPKGDIKK